MKANLISESVIQEGYP